MRHERIEIDPQIMFGKPVIRGTRIPVEHVLRKLGNGFTPEEIIKEHPRLTLDDIRAAQALRLTTSLTKRWRCPDRRGAPAGRRML